MHDQSGTDVHAGDEGLTSTGDDRRITRLLSDWEHEGHAATAGDALLDVVYATLHEMAAARLAASGGGDVVLQPTMLIHEAMLRLLGQQVGFRDRVHFFSLASLKMHAVLVDHARASLACKRGGEAVRVTLSHAEREAAPVDAGMQVLELHDALGRFAQVDRRAARAVELSYFGGMTHEEIALVLSISVPTVERDLRIARAWLKRHMGGASS